MSKSSNILQKEIKSRLHTVDEDTLKTINQLTKGVKLPATVAITEIEEVENTCLVLKFDSLNWNVCQFDQIDDTKIRSLLEKFQKITNTYRNHLPSSGIIRDTVKNIDPYCSLFSKLSPDVAFLYEISLPGNSRMFAYDLGDEFHIVSIETKHRNIDE